MRLLLSCIPQVRSGGLEVSDEEKTAKDTTAPEGMNRKQKETIFKKAAKFFKEAAGADFAAGYAVKCQTCGAKFVYNKRVPTCPNQCQST